METIDSTSQWLLRSALRSRRARFGLFIYAIVLQVVVIVSRATPHNLLTSNTDVGAVHHRVSRAPAHCALDTQARRCAVAAAAIL
jgi:hypothetical protein